MGHGSEGAVVGTKLDISALLADGDVELELTVGVVVGINDGAKVGLTVGVSVGPPVCRMVIFAVG